MTNGRVITAHEATVKTATVEVKSLTISGKQVTLAVFRQLQEDRLIDGVTALLHGVGWGKVNYHPDGCKDDGEHLHVVWQKGDELRRASVRDNPRDQVGYGTRLHQLEDAVSGWVAASVLHDVGIKNVAMSGRIERDASAACIFDGHRVTADIPWQVWRVATWEQNKPNSPDLGLGWGHEPPEPPGAGDPSAWHDWYDTWTRDDAQAKTAQQRHDERYPSGTYPTASWSSEAKQAYYAAHHAVREQEETASTSARRLHQARYARALAGSRQAHLVAVREWFGDAPSDVESNWSDVQTALAEINRFCAAWHARYQELHALDQLFIAV